jgi:chemotaxis protein CheX
MKQEYVNPFIESSINVISQTTGFKPTVGKIYIKTLPYKGDSVVVIIGLTGEIKGSVVISLKTSVACKIASAMMCGMPVPELDEMSKSAISELCNMILGNTASVFSNNNIKIDITPPTLLTGENLQLSPSKSVVMCVPIMLNEEECIEIDISIQEN